ncbi:zinc finger protein 420-like [Toxorhynchites rutilus septentrionalis]|uniref:zinc finger protein 420-like n=1 Tax=Toxorhynchites rutilus septentrionalis TaxID=329112 RepID=UPI00247850AA|nr:zinc finger protein 420-like [Toxorhynchites rutilus septentrionalis]
MLLRHVIPTNNDVEEIYIVKQEEEQTGPNSNPLAAASSSRHGGLLPTSLLENEDVEIKDEPLSIHGSDEEDEVYERYDPPTPLLHPIPVEIKLVKVEDIPKKLELLVKNEQEHPVQQATKENKPELQKTQDHLRDVKRETSVSSDGDWARDDCVPLAKRVQKSTRGRRRKVDVKKEKNDTDSEVSLDGHTDDYDYKPPLDGIKKEKKQRKRQRKKVKSDVEKDGSEESEGEDVVKCFICVSDLKEPWELIKHLRREHKGLLPFKCAVCVSREIHKLKELNLHFRQHDENRKHKCLYCAARFHSAQAQSSHMRRMHNEKYNMDMEKYRRFVCRFCGKKFTKKHDHETHEKRHIRENTNDAEFLKRELKCYICNDFVGGSREDLNTHVTLHNKEWLPYHCQKCDNKKITTARVLCEHLRQHEEGLAVKCVYCEERFVTLAACQAHERSHAAEKEADELLDAKIIAETHNANVVVVDGQKRFQCDKCDRSYTLFSSLRKHQNLHTKSNAFVCSKCGRAFIKASSLALHERRNHDENANFSCEGCGKTFRTIGHLLDHRTRTQHYAGKPYICEGCTTTFRLPEELKEHQETCSETEANRPCFCGLCSNNFDSLAQALEHVKIDHDPEIPETKCRYCDLTFRDAERIVEHEFKHTLPGIMTCTLCNRIFKHLKNLQCHMKNHGKASIPFMCDICGKTFTQKGTLTIHTRLHTGERPYTCQLCQKGFVDKNEMRRHYNMHFNPQSKLYIPNAEQIASPVDIGAQGKKYKQYTCKICGRQLTTSTALAKHITTHTGEKKYQCDFCDKRFAQGGQLTVHRRIHTGERPFACENCGQRFVGGSNYKRHVKQSMCKPVLPELVANLPNPTIVDGMPIVDEMDSEERIYPVLVEMI